jgi:hypothetical protein
MRKVIVLATLLTLLATASFAQAGGAKDSPAASTTCDLGGGKTIKTDYSSPRMKGRKIYGGLVPFGAVWRTGANEATTFVATTDVKVHDRLVPAGSYTMFTVPDGDKWTLIINKKTGEWGIPYKYESDELHPCRNGRYQNRPACGDPRHRIRQDGRRRLHADHRLGNDAGFGSHHAGGQTRRDGLATQYLQWGDRSVSISRLLRPVPRWSPNRRSGRESHRSALSTGLPRR